MLKHVSQVHHTGCLIACTAILLDCSYAQAFRKIFPGRTMPSEDDYADKVHVSVEDALAKLGKFGIKLKRANLKYAKSLNNRTALVTVRWKIMPWLMHTFVYDGVAKKWLDPIYHDRSSSYIIGEVQKNFEAIYYIENSKQFFENIKRKRARAARMNNRMATDIWCSA